MFVNPSIDCFLFHSQNEYSKMKFSYFVRVRVSFDSRGRLTFCQVHCTFFLDENNSVDSRDSRESLNEKNPKILILNFKKLEFQLKFAFSNFLYMGRRNSEQTFL